MRVFAISDLHVDYQRNFSWVGNLSKAEFQEDVLLIAGDISDDLRLLQDTMDILRSRFRAVFYTPGNHDLWTVPKRIECSLDKFYHVLEMARNSGLQTSPEVIEGIHFVPLFSWYDYTFGCPGQELRNSWIDYQRVRWPQEYNDVSIAKYFSELNERFLDIRDTERKSKVISMSHFVPSIKVLPTFIPRKFDFLHPVLGSKILGEQVATLRPDVHVYGHSHVNQTTEINGVRFVNQALGYPNEHYIAQKGLLQIL